MKPRDDDVIVVGGGGAGLAAGVSAAEHGGRAVVLECNPQPGGTTGIAIGSFTAAGTELQRAAGVVDRAEDHADHDHGGDAAYGRLRGEKGAQSINPFSHDRQ